MKKYAVIIVLVFAAAVLTIQAQIACQNKSIEVLAGNFANAYAERDMGQLDRERPYLKSFLISIESSLAEDGSKDQFKIKRFRSMGLLEKWWQSTETNEGESFFPNRQDGEVISCKKGVCTFDSHCCLHNTIFLQKLTYRYKKNGCPYIKKVYFIDGD